MNLIELAGHLAGVITNGADAVSGTTIAIEKLKAFLDGSKVGGNPACPGLQGSFPDFRFGLRRRRAPFWRAISGRSLGQGTAILLRSNEAWLEWSWASAFYGKPGASGADVGAGLGDQALAPFFGAGLLLFGLFAIAALACGVGKDKGDGRAPDAAADFRRQGSGVHHAEILT